MSALPNTVTLPVLPNRRDTATRRLGDLLDTLIAIRIDLGRGANGLVASPALGSAEMQVVRALLEDAIASAKEMFESVLHSATADVVPSFPRAMNAIPIRRMAELGRTPF